MAWGGNLFCSTEYTLNIKGYMALEKSGIWIWIISVIIQGTYIPGILD